MESIKNSSLEIGEYVPCVEVVLFKGGGGARSAEEGGVAGGGALAAVNS